MVSQDQDRRNRHRPQRQRPPVQQHRAQHHRHHDEGACRGHIRPRQQQIEERDPQSRPRPPPSWHSPAAPKRDQRQAIADQCKDKADQKRQIHPRNRQQMRKAGIAQRLHRCPDRCPTGPPSSPPPAKAPASPRHRRPASTATRDARRRLIAWPHLGRRPAAAPGMWV